MSQAVEITLPQAEKQALEKTVRSRKSPVRLVERAKIILMAAQGQSNLAIAEQLTVPTRQVAGEYGMLSRDLQG